MLETRLATVDDAKVIARQRRRIFVDAEQAQDGEMEENFIAWVRPRLGAKRRGIGVVSLHASKFGRPLYERNGFRAGSEMMLRLDGVPVLGS